jgi:uncharacterized protein YjlB
VVGAYPKGQHVDIQTSAASSEMLVKISSVPIPHSDPVQAVVISHREMAVVIPPSLDPRYLG